MNRKKACIFFVVFITLSSVYFVVNAKLVAQYSVETNCGVPGDDFNEFGYKKICLTVYKLYFKQVSGNKYKVIKETCYTDSKGKEKCKNKVLTKDLNRKVLQKKITLSCNNAKIYDYFSYFFDAAGILILNETTAGTFLIISEGVIPALNPTTDRFCGKNTTGLKEYMFLHDNSKENRALYQELEILFETELPRAPTESDFILMP